MRAGSVKLAGRIVFLIFQGGLRILYFFLFSSQHSTMWQNMGPWHNRDVYP